MRPESVCEPECMVGIRNPIAGAGGMIMPSTILHIPLGHQAELEFKQERLVLHGCIRF
jgi:hypothetical protein